MTPISVANLYADLARALAELRRDEEPLVRARAHLNAALADGEPHYGINTGFGALATTRIATDGLHRLQRNLLLSRAVGVGEPVPREITRLMLQLKIVGLGQGYSGVSLPTFRRLLEFEARDLIPWVPSRGSVGASGDLAPLAPWPCRSSGMASFGRETVWAVCRPGSRTEALSRSYCNPKMDWRNQRHAVDECYAPSFSKRLPGTSSGRFGGGHVARGVARKCQTVRCPRAECAAAPGPEARGFNVRRLLTASEILEAPSRNCGKVQDPYCLRWRAQGARRSRDALVFATSTIDAKSTA